MKRIIGVFVLTVMLLSVLTSCALTVAAPTVKSGEFDFSVTYAVNGIENTVSGVYACEYKGIGWAMDSQGFREWSGEINGGEIDEDYAVAKTEDGGTVYLLFGLSPDYFMGDPDGYDRVPVPSLLVKYPEDEYGGIRIIVDADIIDEAYGVKIVSFLYDEPIENSFVLFG